MVDRQFAALGKPQEVESKFNMALATLERMHNLMNLSTHHSIGSQKNIGIVFDAELRLWKEVRPFTRQKLKERKTIDDNFDTLRKMNIILNKSADKFRKNPRTTVLNQQEEININEFAYLLDKTGEQVRDLMDTLKLLMPKSDDPRFAAFT